ncbi:MAG: hypothetical protein AAFX00_03865, partial [Pseudomonadota bacterium]
MDAAKSAATDAAKDLNSWAPETKAPTGQSATDRLREEREKSMQSAQDRADAVKAANAAAESYEPPTTEPEPESPADKSVG